MIKNIAKHMGFFVCVVFLWVSWTPSLSAQSTGTGIESMSGTDDEDWDEIDEYTPHVHDPYEKWNRKVFNFNHKVYTHLFIPLSKGYDFIVPNRVQSGLNNVFTNIRMPVRFFNSIFQGKYKSAAAEFVRFSVNSTAGIGGLLNPAGHAMKLNLSNEDFGQTLAHHNVSEGPFIMWPIIGPSNRRDAIGTLIDNAFSPLFWFGTLDVVMDSGSLRAVSTVKRVNNYTYRVRDNYNSLIEGAIDPYIALQHAYVNNRNKNIKE